LSEAERGLVSGFPLVYADLAVLGGTTTAESAEAAYSLAAASALREALRQARVTMVEPHMKFEVTAPEESVGHIVNDLNRRGANITDLRPIEGGRKAVIGHVPLAKMFGYASTMRSLTAGLGTHSLEPLDYQPVSEDEFRQRLLHLQA
jgi:elongation factor G